MALGGNLLTSLSIALGYPLTDTGVFPIQSWIDFEQQFRSQFFPVNTEADAINALEGSSYYQGN